MVACAAPSQLDVAPTPEALAALDAHLFPDAWAAHDYASLLALPTIEAAVLTVGETPVGLACWQSLAREAELLRIGVLPAYRGHGHARCLLAHVLAVGRERGWRRLFLEVRASNAPAIALYDREGFTRTGRRRGYYVEPAEDALVYEYRFRTA